MRRPLDPALGFWLAAGLVAVNVGISLWAPTPQVQGEALMTAALCAAISIGLYIKAAE